MSHLPSVYSPNTDDIEGELREIKRLEPQKAILNAETYNQYASCEFFFRVLIASFWALMCQCGTRFC